MGLGKEGGGGLGRARRLLLLPSASFSNPAVYCMPPPFQQPASQQQRAKGRREREGTQKARKELKGITYRFIFLLSLCPSSTLLPCLSVTRVRESAVCKRRTRLVEEAPQKNGRTPGSGVLLVTASNAIGRDCVSFRKERIFYFFSTATVRGAWCRLRGQCEERKIRRRIF